MAQSDIRPGRLTQAEHRIGDLTPLTLPPGKDSPGLAPPIAVHAIVSPEGRVIQAWADDRQLSYYPELGHLQEQAEAQVMALRYRPFLRGGEPVSALIEEHLPVLPPSRPASPAIFPDGALADAQVTLERTACFGTCPAYRVTLLGSGEVIWNGGLYTAVPGEVRTRVDPSVVKSLLDRAKDANFFGLRNDYSARVTDGAAYVVSISYGGRHKTVTDYFGLEVGMPWSVLQLEDAIDRAAGTARWIEGNEETVPSLKSAGWDLSSREAGAVLTRMLSGHDPGRISHVALSLVEAGAPIDVIVDRPWNEHLGPPIVGAAAAGDLALFRALIDRGALAKADQALMTETLVAAASAQEPKAVALLLALHAPVNDRAQNGDTALIAATRARDDERSVTSQRVIVRQLLKAGADVNGRGGGESTPLTQARDPVIVTWLLAKGADPNATDSIDRRPLDYATDEQVALILLKAGGWSKATKSHDGSMMSRAIHRGWWRVVLWLLTHKTPPN